MGGRHSIPEVDLTVDMDSQSHCQGVEASKSKYAASFYLMDAQLPDETFVVSSHTGQKTIRFPDGSYSINYCCMSLPGYYPEEPNHVNQDNFLCELDYVIIDSTTNSTSCTSTISSTDCCLFGVFDGHGQQGHFCSEFSKDYFSKKLKSHEEFGSNIRVAFHETFINTNEALHNSSIDDSQSGTTAICVFIRGQTIYIGNVGDSRAIGILSTEAKHEVMMLSVDQTPFREDELERVKKAGAEVLCMAQRDGRMDHTIQTWGTEEDHAGDPPRIWAPGKRYPGNAFTRSLGDKQAESLGVNAIPEMMSRTISLNDKYIVIGSDGVFEFLSNEEICSIIVNSPNVYSACYSIIKQSHDIWLLNDVRTDDITIIVIELDDYQLPQNVVKNEAGYFTQNRPVRERTHYLKHKAERVRALTKDEEHYTYPDEPACPPGTFQTIVSVLRSQLAFQDFEPKLINDLAKTVTVVDVETNTLIIKQGEIGSFFYILYTGRVGVHTINKENVRTRVHVFDASYSYHPSFGDEALLYEFERNASIISETRCTLYAIPKMAFRCAILRDEPHSHYRALRGVPLFASLNDDEIVCLSEAAIEVRFHAGHVVADQKHKLDLFYVVQSGSLVATFDENVDVVVGKDDILVDDDSIDPDHHHTLIHVAAKTEVTCFTFPKTLIKKMVDFSASASLHCLIMEAKREGEFIRIYQGIIESSGISHTDLSEFQSISYLYTYEESEYYLIELPQTSEMYTMRKMSKFWITKAKQQNIILRERTILNRKKIFQAIPFMLATYRTPDCLCYIYKTTTLYTLHSLVKIADGLSQDTVRYILAELAMKLCFLHVQGILFRGIDQESICYDENGRVQLLSFKYSKLCKGRTYTMCIPPHYMCPNMVAGIGHDYNSDFWALGVLGFELLMDQNPFDLEGKESEMNIYYNIMNFNNDINLSPPYHVNTELFIAALLRREAHRRLGFGAPKEVMNKIRLQPWMKGIPWDRYDAGTLESPLYNLAQSQYSMLSSTPHVSPMPFEQYTGDAAWCSTF